MKIHGSDRITNEQASFSDIERACSKFFTNPLGKRESYSVHRGFLIVRGTDVHCSNAPVRRTSVFLFLPEGYGDESARPDLFCVSACASLNNISQAKRYIDALLAHGDYSYGWQNEVVEQ